MSSAKMTDFENTTILIEKAKSYMRSYVEEVVKAGEQFSQILEYFGSNRFEKDPDFEVKLFELEEVIGKALIPTLKKSRGHVKKRYGEILEELEIILGEEIEEKERELIIDKIVSARESEKKKKQSQEQVRELQNELMQNDEDDGLKINPFVIGDENKESKDTLIFPNKDLELSLSRKKSRTEDISMKVSSDEDDYELRETKENPNSAEQNQKIKNLDFYEVKSSTEERNIQDISDLENSGVVSFFEARDSPNPVEIEGPNEVIIPIEPYMSNTEQDTIFAEQKNLVPKLELRGSINEFQL